MSSQLAINLGSKRVPSRSWWRQLVFKAPTPPDSDLDAHVAVPGEEHSNWVFVSHTTLDASRAKEILQLVAQDACLALHLVNRGSAPVVSEAYRKKILRSLALCGRFIAVVSKQAKASQWVHFEVEWAAVHRDASHAITLQLDDTLATEIHPWLGMVVQIDCSSKRRLNDIQDELRLAFQNWCDEAGLKDNR